MKESLQKYWNLLRKLPYTLRAILLLSVLVVGYAQWWQPREDHGILGLVIPGSRYADGWYGANYDAAGKVCADMHYELRTADSVGDDEAALFDSSNALLRMGAKLIVLAGPEDPQKFRTYMRSHPFVQFSGFDASVTEPNYHPVLFGLYQVRYLSGILAALMSKRKILGFVAAKPDPEIVRGINAFALGAQRVHPKIRILLKWTGTWSDEQEEEQAVSELKDAGADLIAYHQLEEYVPRAAERLKVNFIGMSMPLSGYSNRALTSVVCDWENYYRLLLRFMDDHAYVPPQWAGIDSGAVDLAGFSSRVPKSVRDRVLRVKKELTEGKLKIFPPALTDTNGIKHSAEDDSWDDPVLLNGMNYLIDGVETVHARH